MTMRICGEVTAAAFAICLAWLTSPDGVKAPPDKAGARVACPGCGAKLIVPDAAPEAVAPAPPVKPSPPPPPPEEFEEPRVDELEEVPSERRPAKKKRPRRDEDDFDED